jgi:hypothetical protein
MALKDKQRKEIAKKLENYLKDKNEESKSELSGQDYLPALADIWVKLSAPKMEAAIELLASDPSPDKNAQLGIILKNPINPFKIRLVALDALKKLDASGGSDEAANKLEKMRRVAIEDDPVAGVELAKELNAEDMEAWVSFLVERKAAQTVSEIGAAISDKRVQKAMKRAAYEMRAKGVEIADWSEKGTSVLKPLEKEEPLAMSAIHDWRGKLILFVYMPIGDNPRDSYFIHTILDQKNGIEDFDAVNTSPGKGRSAMKKLTDNKDAPIYDIPVGFAFHLLDSYAERNARQGTALPPAYLQIKRYAPKPDDSAISASLKNISSDITYRDELEAVGLLKDSWIGTYAPDEESLNLCQAKLDQAMTSALVISESQRADQVQKVFEDSAKEYLTANNRSLLAEKLYTAAQILAWNNLNEKAKLALAAAEEVKKENSTPRFVVEMFRRLFPDLESALKQGIANKPEAEKANTGGGIIIP